MGSCYSYCTTKPAQEPSILFSPSQLDNLISSPRSLISATSPDQISPSPSPSPSPSSPSYVPPISSPSLAPCSIFLFDSILPPSSPSIFPSTSDPEIEIMKLKMMNEHRLYQEYKSKKAGVNKKLYDNESLNWNIRGERKEGDIDSLDLLENNEKKLQSHRKKRNEPSIFNYGKSFSLLQNLNFKVNFPDPEEKKIKPKRNNSESLQASKAATLPPNSHPSKGRQIIKKEELFLNKKIASKLNDIINSSVEITIIGEAEKIKSHTEPEELTDESPGDNQQKLDKLIKIKNIDIDGREKFQRSQNSKEIPLDGIEITETNEESPLSKTIYSGDFTTNCITKTTGNMTEKTDKTGKNFTEVTASQKSVDEKKMPKKKILKTRTIGEERPKNKKSVRFIGVNFNVKKKRGIFL